MRLCVTFGLAGTRLLQNLYKNIKRKKFIESLHFTMRFSTLFQPIAMGVCTSGRVRNIVNHANLDGCMSDENVCVISAFLFAENGGMTMSAARGVLGRK